MRSSQARRVAVLFAAVLTVLLTACADQSGDAGSTPSPSPATPGTGSPEPPPAPSPTPSLPAPTLPPPASPPVQPPPSDKSGMVTLTGEVYAGVEGGCKLIATGSGDYLLIGAAADQIRTGSTVTVRGMVRAGMMTTCQQGTPFEVAEVMD